MDLNALTAPRVSPPLTQVYNEAGTHMLPRVMRALALAGRGQPSTSPSCRNAANGGSNGTDSSCQAGGGCRCDRSSGSPHPDAAPILYFHTKHRLEVCDVHFLEQCAVAGLAVEEAWEPGAPRPPPSPPPLTELFPDMRCVVYRISVLQ
jgi:hypothetical protein